MFAETNLILSFRVSSAVLESKKTHAAWKITHCLRHSSETYERNIRVLEAEIFGLKNNTARGLEHYSLQTLNHNLQISFFFLFSLVILLEKKQDLKRPVCT